MAEYVAPQNGLSYVLIFDDINDGVSIRGRRHSMAGKGGGFHTKNLKISQRISDLLLAGSPTCMPDHIATAVTTTAALRTKPHPSCTSSSLRKRLRTTPCRRESKHYREGKHARKDMRGLHDARFERCPIPRGLLLLL